MNNWQPIETAPKDKKTRVLLFEPNFRGVYIGIGQWVKNSMHDFVPVGELFRKEEVDCSYWEWLGNNPTHWMPLPQPPEFEA